MTAPTTDPGLTLAEFVYGIRDLINGASHTDLPDPNRLDVELYDGTDGTYINVIARYRNDAGDDRRQHCLLRVVEISEPEWNHDHGESLD
ncbi:hypothetical protein [Lentzea aerocolonigenes]|uniref:hypothetical protein n=1 Tax=Lentzea aerocolonigenes TaxID=68170 RepID=UPI0004C3EDB7|nr:hypothetical protein [Lentzea aerocolonigenes]MCP2243310.1 hypothetical protein [Lentzea aerocolonigenes]